MSERQDRLEEIMAEMLIKQDSIIDELRGLNNKMGGTNDRLDKLERQMEGSNSRLDKLEKQMILNNKGIGEVRLSVMKLAEHQKVTFDLDRRVRKVETVLVKNKLK